MNFRSISCMLVTCAVAGFSGKAQVRLPRLVRDSMVLQRDVPLKIWGWASRGENVTVRFAGKKAKTRTGKDGKWSVSLPAVGAGGPYEMKIIGSNQIILRDILVGDVWFCSGQSNMVHYLDLHSERYAREIAEANYPQIRQFLVPTVANLIGPADDFPRGNWKPATAKNIGRFSVVAYFFALQLHEKYHVPIGIINSSVGGTPIEAWTSEERLAEFPDLLNKVRQNKDTSYVGAFTRKAAAAARQAASKKPVDKGLTDPIPWYDTAYIPKNWQNINIPGYWDDQGIKDLDGVVWYRREIDLPPGSAKVPARVTLGRIVDADFLYVNGKLIGNTTYQYPQRRYQIPAGVLKTGKNTFVIRVLNYSGKGGFVPDKPYFLTVGGQAFDLKGYWQYKVGEVYARDSNMPPVFAAQNQPAALFNGMVAPATSFALKGFVWYQGEANAGRAAGDYVKQLPALIGDWRRQWLRADLPFLFVQLPNFLDATYTPGESQWATLREGQLKTLKVSNTAMAVTIDLGEWNDVHPDNKKPVSDRLVLAAQHLAYGDASVVYSGPLFKSAAIAGNKIVVRFSQTGSGLASRDGEELSSFAIAGQDKKFVWAKARIENNTVVVWSDAVPEPAFVRYAWADNPVGANLGNEEGMPASPFRTDQ